MKVVAIVLLLCMPALALPQDAVEQVKKIESTDAVESIPAGTWTVAEHISHPDGHAEAEQSAKPMQISGGVKVNDQLLLEEQGSGRLLVCQEQAPHSAKAWKQYQSFKEYIDANSYAPLPK